MSYDITLVDADGKIVSVPAFEDGGTYATGGTDVAKFNVTYNYSRYFLFDLLDGCKAGDTIDKLQEAVTRLGTIRDNDYWAATPGNAGAAAERLLAWARLHPTATWEVH